jgi:hypothetical protein
MFCISVWEALFFLRAKCIYVPKFPTFVVVLLQQK